ncbi:MAG: ATP-dependent zinc metalloprotease FtsH [Candidatus Obscuribacterales bacterium]
MKLKNLMVIFLIAVAAVMLWGPISGIQNASNPPSVTQTQPDGTVVNVPAKTAPPADGKPVPMSYDTLYRDLSTTPGSITKLQFVKDEAGNVQYVNAEYKDGRKVRVEIPGQAGAAQLLDAATKGNVANDTKNRADDRTFLDSLIGWLPMLLMVGLFIWFIRRQAGAAGAQRTQLSQIKEQQKSTQRVTFADVAGADEAKQELMEVVSYLRNPGRLKRLGGKAPSGVLLIGDPGNGKTLIAKAVAGEADAEFHMVSGSDFVEMFVGVGAARVRELFAKARAKRPSVVFIDEIDAVGRQRGTGVGGGNDEREQTLNQILVEMDGFNDNEGIIFMAATNRPDILDPALTRPGRFGLHVLVDSPDKFGREGILKVHAKGKKLAPGVSLDMIASNTPGFSGAQLAELMNEATRVADRRIEKEILALMEAKKISKGEATKLVPELISLHDLDEAADRVQMGPAKEGRAKRMSRLDMLNTAVHELGHAWVSQDQFERELGGYPVTKITIVPRARALGYTMAMPVGDSYGMTEQNLRARIRMAMGGRAAQEVFLNTIDTGASNDFKQSWGIALRMVTEFGMSNLGPISIGEGGGNPFLGRSMASGHQLSPDLANAIDVEVKRIVTECLDEVKALLLRDKECFMKIVDVLMVKETLLGFEFVALRNETVCAVTPPAVVLPIVTPTIAEIVPHAVEAGSEGDTSSADEAPVTGGDKGDAAPAAVAPVVSKPDSDSGQA